MNPFNEIIERLEKIREELEEVEQDLKYMELNKVIVHEKNRKMALNAINNAISYIVNDALFWLKD